MADTDDASRTAASRAARPGSRSPGVPDLRRPPGAEDPDGAPAAPHHGVCTAIVTEVVDAQQAGRVGIELPQESGPARRLMARLATLHAGSQRGTWFLPDVGDHVLVAFEDGDPQRPVVIGSLWADGATPPMPDGHDSGNDIKLFRSRAGTVLEFDDSSSSTVELRTAAGTRVHLSDGAVVVEDAAGNRVEMGGSGITIEAAGEVTIHGSKVEVVAGAVSVDSGMTTFSGVVKATTVIADSIVASNYTPGAGNLW